ncbi:5-oxoprolinase subunit C family protein [Flammeovirga kamogawensis]|uniref:Biotin-dependent carboxyltransferase family protein n=1 Tax=Flammeovirga kamogawensis TaxID=373891 RepID=A0ABX8GT17_9BACT|nr:biotin-dependent carboxyltransferase family protein [Flammeovirga kamogawensis]MBB6462914.1 antagonist of KipI [Flammeovirga kamogawensis]QWG06443.1 biotin-dependent carboxyltransferase family protein [Flammeovirga kamogawensis]TRX68274.1 biotin-dependent carboxyltransferase family protein [Flammeovirga kamogawensis]
MSFEIIKGGFLTTIQDSGRYGVQDQGIPVSGFMDESSAQIANSLLGNPINSAVLECCMIGCTIKAHTEFSIAFFGAHMELKLNNHIVSQGKIITLTTDDILSIGFAKQGMYGYLAISGSIDIPKIYNSKSTYLPSQFGGYKGRKLEKGDIISLSNLKILPNSFSVVKQQVFTNFMTLEVMRGPEWNDLPVESQQKLLSSTYTIGKDISRIGYRIEGKPIPLGEKKEIISSGMLKGTIQITSAGIPIIMMADSPTSGGYLRVLNLTARACDQLAQLQPNYRITFQFLTKK